MSIHDLLQRSRQELLDLSARNRLLSIPVDSRSARLIQIHDELSEEVFRLLVTERKPLTFRAARPSKPRGAPVSLQSCETPDSDDEEVSLPQPDEAEDPVTGAAKRHVDSRLQTALTSEGLQRRLLALCRDAQAMIEEQGVNILYLVLGHLKWFEAEHADIPRYAPLILVPVELQRRTASERFHLRWREEDLQENLSLAAKLRIEFGTELPAFPDDDDFTPTDYFASVSKAIAGAKGWEALPDAITLGFFSFAKFLMYRDLDPDNWPKREDLLAQPFIAGLLQDGFPGAEALLAEDVPLDELIPAARLDHVVDADSSQTLAIESARRGRTLVIQGPPGTGKSQSIANIISTAVLDGKKVLFVAEKLAAMEVVKRRLEREGLGPLCLELHSNKANKRAVIEEIGRTWKLGRPKPSNPQAVVTDLERRRALLNRHAALLHERHSPSPVTPFEVMGRLTLLGDAGREAADLTFPGAESWTADDRHERRKLVGELSARIEQMGLPAQSPWRGVCRDTVLNIDLPPLEAGIRSLSMRTEELRHTASELATNLDHVSTPASSDVGKLCRVAEFVCRAPPVDKQALCHEVWDGPLDRVRRLLSRGRDVVRAVSAANELATTLSGVSPDHLSLALPAVHALTQSIAALRETSSQLASRLLQPAPLTLAGCARHGLIAEFIGQAPPLDEHALSGSVWDERMDALQGLLAKGRDFATAVYAAGEAVSESAWLSDFSEGREAIATHGASALRFLNSKYRRAMSQLRAVLKGGLPPALPDRLALVERIIRGQRAYQAMQAVSSFGESAFGHHWRGPHTDWSQLAEILQWVRRQQQVGLNSDFRKLFALICDKEPVRQLTGLVLPQIAKVRDDLHRVLTTLEIEASAMLGTADVESVSFDTIAAQLGRLENLARCHAAVQVAVAKVRAEDSLGRDAFGALWNSERSDWTHLEGILTWVETQEDAGLGADFRRLFSRINDHAGLEALLAETTKRLQLFHEQTKSVFHELKLHLPTAFGQTEIEQIPFAALAERCTEWLSTLEGLSRWANYYLRAGRARDMGLAGLLGPLETGSIPARSAVDCFERAYCSQVLRYLTGQRPELAQFDGDLHDSIVAEFRQLDRERLALARHQTLASHFERMPPSTGSIGPAGIVRSEMERKRGHRSVRRLLKDAGSVVQSIKPVFMMSPLSVAQFLEPGAVEFDLLVIDEASQVQPVDALGAIARCKQAVVVGDSKQLPPTRFFTRLTSDSDEADEDEDEIPQTAEAKDMESILGLCAARGLPQAMLRWHYRSQHHSLIAVSNDQFYENRLFIVPSPFIQASEYGLKFHHVPEGVFDVGATGTNQVEARTICRAILEHAREFPALSLGVAAFSVRQQQAILDELEFLRRENPETEAFFSGHPTEPFFVKNLENVQGDERDVVFISVGYGRDANGYMAMRFGPLSHEGGERRLNVLISRAKKRCHVFSSITADDIDLNRAAGRGVAALKAFLSFAQTGRLGIAEQSGREAESPFEEAVRRALESLGHEVHPQVGVAGFFIDLAVVDRECTGRYLLGIECDGARYHSSRCARDRDRLRQAVLEDHGWLIHRIWSTDWFQRPADQLGRLREAMESARRARKLVTNPQVPEVKVETENAVAREEGTEASDPNGLAIAYSEARFDVRRHIEPHELVTDEMAKVLLRVVEHEGPVHEDELVTRVRDLWDLGRAGNRIQDAVAKGVRFLIRTRQCVREDGFLSIPGASVPLRRRDSVKSPNLRRPEFLPPAEIRAAVLRLIDTHHGAAECEITTAVARLFGFKSTGGQLRHVIDRQVAKLRRQGLIAEQDGMLKRTEPRLE